MAAHIVRLAGVQPGDHVVEVGPGLGSLTLALCDAGAHVSAVELDHRLADVLAEVVAGRPVDIVQADALTVDWAQLLADHDHWMMVSNLPYNVATPVVVRALETAPSIDRFLVMVQREVGERLAAVPGTRPYGALSVKVAYFAEADLVGCGAADRVRPQAEGRERARAAAAPPRNRRSTSPTPIACSSSCAAGSRRGARCCAARWTRRSASEPRRRSAPRASTRRARAETLTLAQWAALAHAEATGVSAESRVDAFAKLTLSLHVIGTRADGYHDLDMLVVPLTEPHDELAIRPATVVSITSTVPTPTGYPPTKRTSPCARARRSAPTSPSPCRSTSLTEPGSEEDRRTRRPCSPARPTPPGDALPRRRAHRGRRSAPTCPSASAAPARCGSAVSATISWGRRSRNSRS